MSHTFWLCRPAALSACDAAQQSMVRPQRGPGTVNAETLIVHLDATHSTGRPNSTHGGAPAIPLGMSALRMASSRHCRPVPPNEMLYA